jgi:hypothetical protein
LSEEDEDTRREYEKDVVKSAKKVEVSAKVDT